MLLAVGPLGQPELRHSALCDQDLRQKGWPPVVLRAFLACTCEDCHAVQTMWAAKSAAL